MNFKGAIFDLDGTLLDSLGIWRQVDETFLAERGIEMPEDYTKAVTTKTFYEAAVYTIDRFHMNNKPEELVEIWLNMVVRAYARDVGLKPGAKKYLEYLKKQNIKIAAATSSKPEAFEACLKHNGIYDYFDVIVTTDMAKRPKGFPDVYELAAEKLGLANEECIVFEDILVGLKGANMGGFISCGCYDALNPDPVEEMKAEARLYITNFEELIPQNF